MKGRFVTSGIAILSLVVFGSHRPSHGPVLSPTECVKPGYMLQAKQQLPFAFVASDLIWDGSDAVIVKHSPADYDLKPEIRVLIP